MAIDIAGKIEGVFLKTEAVGRRLKPGEVNVSPRRRLLVDGVEFPWYLAEVGPHVEEIEDGGGISIVWVPILAETVSGLNIRKSFDEEQLAAIADAVDKRIRAHAAEDFIATLEHLRDAGGVQ